MGKHGLSQAGPVINFGWRDCVAHFRCGCAHCACSTGDPCCTYHFTDLRALFPVAADSIKEPVTMVSMEIQIRQIDSQSLYQVAQFNPTSIVNSRLVLRFEDGRLTNSNVP